MIPIPSMSLRALSLLLLLLLALSSATIASAATFRSGENYTLERDATLEDNLYVAGSAVFIDGTVAGDLLAAGGEVTVNGPVGEDAMLAGGRVSVGTDVGGDVRAVGGEVTLTGSVGGDAALAGGTLRIEASTEVAGDLVVVADVLVVDGVVKGDLMGHVRVLTLNGRVEGDTSLSVRESVALTDTAYIGGNFAYHAPREATRSEQAIVGGTTDYQPLSQQSGGASSMVSSFVMTLLMVLVPALVLFYLIPRHLHVFTERVVRGNGYVLLWGVLSLVVIPIAAVVSIITVVGVLPGVVALLFYVALLALARVLSSVVAGAILVVWLMRKDVSHTRMYHVVLGFVALEFISLVPVLGFLAVAVVYLAVFGTLVRMLYETLLTSIRSGAHVTDTSTIPIAFAPPPETYTHDYENEPRKGE